MIHHDGSNDLDGLADFVFRSTERLAAEYKNGTFDSIVATGMSGLIVAVPVHLATGIPLVIVRKAGEDCHSRVDINRKNSGTKTLFLDDFECSGATLGRVKDAIRNIANLDPKGKNYRDRIGCEVVGYYYYKYDDFSLFEPDPPVYVAEDLCDICYRYMSDCQCDADHGFRP